MTIGTVSAIVLVGLGLISAVVFGVQARRHLARVLETPPLARPHSANAADPAADVPTMRFKGQPFESRWGGSEGYERTDETWERASRNWTDYVIAPVVTVLRPSRFSDPSYWTRYLPGVYALRISVLIVLPLLFLSLEQPGNGPEGTFSPSAAQRAVPVHSADYVTDPAVCGTSTSGVSPQGQPVFVNYVDDGNVIWVRPGTRVVISYLYGKPLFSQSVPLCVPAAPGDRTGVVEYQATSSGTGYIYIPQPKGTVVAEISVPPDYSALVYAILGATGAVIIFDVIVLLRLRRATQARWTRV
ncbi:MAG TPA: hypothetical protein VIX84_15300 [Acidimicrobiales bacterium]